MKIIITESQYDKLVNNPNYIWLLRRYDLVKDAFGKSINYVNPCKFKTFEEYESFFYNFFMDVLHPEYYLFDDFDYNGVMSELKDMFYVEVTEHYFDKKEKCL